MSAIRDAVELYIERGFRVIPLHGVTDEGLCRCPNPDCKLRDGGKHEPVETDGQWKDGRIFTADDFTEQNNVAIAMGPWKDGTEWLVALDVDRHDDVNAFFYPHLPPTLTQSTPRGAHFIYTVPPFTPLGNWVDLFKGKVQGIPTLDLRYARGRIVVEPSRGTTGAYQWRDWRRPAPLPEHVLANIYELRRAQGHELPGAWERRGKQPW